MVRTHAECQKKHLAFNGGTDGCLEYEAAGEVCGACGCHRSFHRRVDFVYTKCNKIHGLYSESLSVDGCQEFTAKNPDAEPKDRTCALCGCAMGFHRNDVAKETTSTS